MSKPKKIVVANTKGGVAKSTTVRNLATIAAADGLTVATVDLDTQRTLSRWVDRRPSEANRIAHFDATMADVADLDAITNVDVVIIDTPPLVTESDPGEQRLHGLRRLMTFADLFVVPTLQQIEDVEATTAFMRVLGKAGVRSFSLLSATTRRTNSYNDAKRKLALAGMLCPIDIQRLEDIAHTSRQGIGINELHRGKGQDDFVAVWQFAKKEIGLAEEC